ncbi:hypothetical protein [Pseudomonas sp. C11]|uniref:hypothetical protein n=1 Tax=Pseudomonas sp. C11 TaxID=3075550 RepID=UPI002AFF4973|nr:hypothetical protein [Pseudomonas sp. C11]
MNEPLTLKSIALRFINRIANPSFENKAIGAFLVSGFAFLYFSQPLSINGRIQLDFGFLKADLAAGNDPNWYLFSLGVFFIAYGGYALFKLKLAPPVSRRSEIGELLLMIEQKKSQLKNAQIQQFFSDLFKIKAPVPIIEKLLSADDPTGCIYDYRFAGHLVSLRNNSFVSAKPTIDHQRQVTRYSWAYYAVSFTLLTCMAAPLAPFIDAPSRQQLSVLGFPFAIALGLVAALILSLIRAHSAALRLLASPAGESPEAKKDRETMLKLLNSVHTPTFDNFIYYGRLHFIDNSIFHFWEGLNGKINASNFHIYDDDLRVATLGLHANWGKSLSFGKYFINTNNGHFHKFDSRDDNYRDQEAKAAHDAFSEAINEADQYLRSLLALVREKFPDIDIETTNSIALADYRSYQLEDI